MLVLSRKVGQELVIGDNIRITVNRVGGSRVTLGITAPEEVRIVRAELEPIVCSFGSDAAPLAEAAGEATGVEEVAEVADDSEQLPRRSVWPGDASPTWVDLARQVH
jgi:carbon storage regulator